MKTHVFLTPATKDKAGELVEVQVSNGPVKYLEPLPYWSANDAALAKLQTQLAAAETALRHAISKNRPPLEIQRLENILSGLKAELDAAEYPGRTRRARETGIGRDDVPQTFQSLVESVAATLAGVKAPPATEKKKKGKMSWEEYLKDLDERLAKRAAEALRRGETIPVAVKATIPASNAAATCCSGQYKCPRCAKAAA